MRRPGGWIAAVVGLLGAVAIGVTGASFVFPSDQPKAVASPGETAIKIDPTPSSTPVPVMPPVKSSPQARIVLPRYAKLRLKSTAPVPDPDPDTVTTINSW